MELAEVPARTTSTASEEDHSSSETALAWAFAARASSRVGGFVVSPADEDAATASEAVAVLLTMHFQK